MYNNNTLFLHIRVRLFFIVLCSLMCFLPGQIYAAYDYQNCDSGSSCVVGEFLYDDSFDPIATASCTLTSRYPDGSLFINGDDMDSQTDGWYSYTIQATGSAGLYRSQICCTFGTDYLCLDKSFTVKEAVSTLTSTDVANAVWNEPRLSHTASGTFGEALQNIAPSSSQIAEAVWSHSNRNLTGFGTLVSDIWGYSTTSFTSLSNLFARKKDIETVQTEVEYNQTLLEKLANKPIISNSLEEEPDVDLEAKLNESASHADSLFADIYSLENKLETIDDSWKELENTTVITLVGDVSKLIDAISKKSAKTKALWSFDVIDAIVFQSEAVKSRIAVIQNELAIEDKPRMALEDIRNMEKTVAGMMNTIGTLKDDGSKKTVYGKLQEIKQLADTFDLYEAEIEKLLSDWETLQLPEIQKKANSIAENLSAINRLPKSVAFIYSDKTSSLEHKLKNRLFSMKGTIEANKRLLAASSTKPFTNSWFEIGSVVFKTLITNPSTRISQEAPLKYYLPSEVEKEDVISVDEGLTVNYDVEKKQLYVEGSFTLAPFESKVVSVRVEDIWSISSEELESLRKQAQELAKPLANTSYFGQSVTITSNIDVILDKILNSQKSSLTPEAKIKNYYDAQIELASVRGQIKKLEELVGQSGSFGSLAGFVGGAQAVGVWGTIIIMITGFVFLLLYMKVIRGKESEVFQPVKKVQPSKKSCEQELPPIHNRYERWKFFGLFFLCSAMSSLTTGILLYTAISQTPQVQDKDLVAMPADRSIPIAGVVLSAADELVTLPSPNPIMVSVIPPEGKGVKIHTQPAMDSSVVGIVHAATKYPKKDEANGWVHIEMPDGAPGYVYDTFVHAVPQQE